MRRHLRCDFRDIKNRGTPEFTGHPRIDDHEGEGEEAGNVLLGSIKWCMHASRQGPTGGIYESASSSSGSSTASRGPHNTMTIPDAVCVGTSFHGTTY